jgi:hypothetical protein
MREEKERDFEIKCSTLHHSCCIRDIIEIGPHYSVDPDIILRK